MHASISIWGVILGGLSAMVVGALWYSPVLFGKPWAKAMGTTEKEMAKARARLMPILIAVSLLTALVMSLFVVYFQNFTRDSWLMSGFDTAVLAWFGFAGTALVAHGAWDPRPKDLLYINLGNRLVTLLVMGLIISAFLN